MQGAERDVDEVQQNRVHRPGDDVHRRVNAHEETDGEDEQGLRRHGGQEQYREC